MHTSKRTVWMAAATALWIGLETFALALNGDLQGLNKNDSANWSGSSPWKGRNLHGWQELDMVPCRVVLHGPADNGPVSITFPRTRKGLPGFDDLFFISNSPNVMVTGAPVLEAPVEGGRASYRLAVTIQGDEPAYIYFYARLAAGVHRNKGSSLQLRGEPALSPLQIHKPQAAFSKPDLGVSITAPAQALPGETIIYSVQFTNGATGSNDIAGNVSLKAVLPEGMSLVPGSASAGAQVDGNTVTWSLGTLGAGASGSMTCQAVVSSGILVCGVLTTTAAIQGSENDLNPADNMASAHTVVGSANPETGGGPLRITRIAKFDEEIYQVFFQTNPGRNYVLQYTEDFSNWTTDPVVIPGTGTVVVSRQRQGGAARYYRVMELP